MKRLLILLAVLVALVPSTSRASNLYLSTTQRVAARSNSDCQPRGLCGRLFHHGAASRAPRAVVTYVFPNASNPTCPPHLTYGGGGGCHFRPLHWAGAMIRLHHQHCFPNCYLGTPCSCCNHYASPVAQGSLARPIYLALIKTHLWPAAKIVQGYCPGG